MSATTKEAVRKATNKVSGEQDVMSDIRYIRKACSQVTDALKKRCDVLQMPNGDIVITEIRTVSFQYTWNDAKSKFEKVKSGSRLRKLRKALSTQESRTPPALPAQAPINQPAAARRRAAERVLAD